MTDLATRVAQFVKLRSRKSELKEQFDKELAKYDVTLQKLSAAIIEALTAQGVRHTKTANGETCTLVNKDSASLADPDAFMRFVRENDKFELMDRKANVKAVRDYIAEHGGHPPPGVTFNSFVSLRVSKGKGETNGDQSSDDDATGTAG